MPAPLDRRLLRESAAARPHLCSPRSLGVLGAVLIVAQAALLAYVIARAALGHASATALRPQLIALGAVLLARAVAGGAFELSGRLGAQRVMSELRARLARHLLLHRPSGRPGAGAHRRARRRGRAGRRRARELVRRLPAAARARRRRAAGGARVDRPSVDPIAAAILAVTIPILIVFMILIGKGAQAQTARRWRALALLSAHFLDVVRGLQTLRAHRREHAQARILADVGERYRRETMGTLRVAFLSALVLELCAMIGTALVAATIGVQLAGGHLSLTPG